MISAAKSFGARLDSSRELAMHECEDIEGKEENEHGQFTFSDLANEAPVGKINAITTATPNPSDTLNLPGSKEVTPGRFNISQKLKDTGLKVPAG